MKIENRVLTCCPVCDDAVKVLEAINKDIRLLQIDICTECEKIVSGKECGVKIYNEIYNI